MVDRDETLLRRAIALSREKMEDGEGGPFGAVIAADGEVVSEGWNRVTSSLDPTAHAEVEAIRSACRRLGRFELRGCTIYSSCEPCPMCLAAVYWARLDRLVYAASREDAAAIGFDDEALYRQIALPPEERELRIDRLLRDEALEVFRSWDEKEDKVRY